MAKLNIEMFGENSILIKSGILKIRNLLLEMIFQMNISIHLMINH